MQMIAMDLVCFRTQYAGTGRGAAAKDQITAMASCQNSGRQPRQTGWPCSRRSVGRTRATLGPAFPSAWSRSGIKRGDVGFNAGRGIEAHLTASSDPLLA